MQSFPNTCFTDEKAEAQRGYETCLRSHLLGAKLGLGPRQSGSRVVTLNHQLCCSSILNCCYHSTNSISAAAAAAAATTITSGVPNPPTVDPPILVRGLLGTC